MKDESIITDVNHNSSIETVDPSIVQHLHKLQTQLKQKQAENAELKQQKKTQK